jgi:molecular chaperone DnaJ
MFRMQTTCPSCRGRGTVIVDKCADCRGSGRVSVKRKLSVKLPAGIHDGQAVRIANEGEPPAPEMSPNGQGIRGDLHVVVRVREHDKFERDGDDLLLAATINFTQMALGSRIEVPGIDAPRELTIPPGTQHGALFRIHDAGLPNLRSGKRGDLVVVAQLLVPRKLTESQRKLLAEYAQTEDVNISAPQQSTWEKLKRAVKGG